MKACLLAILCIVAVINGSEAATYYVSPAGLDTNPGTESLPFATPAKGNSVLKPGDTMLISAGTYAIGRINVKSGSGESARVYIRNVPGHKVKFVRNPASTQWRFAMEDAKYVTIAADVMWNMEFDGTTVSGAADHHIYQWNVYQNLEIHHVLSTTCTSTGSGGKILDVYLHHCGTGTLDHGIYQHSSDVLIDGLICHDITGYCAQYQNTRESQAICQDDCGVNNVTIRNSYAHHSGYGFLLRSASGRGNAIYNNVVHDVGGRGITADIPEGFAGHNTVTRANLGSGAISPANCQFQVVYASTRIENNLVWAGGHGRPDFCVVNGPIDPDGPIPPQMRGNLFGPIDPLVVAAAAGDLRLRPGSPAINAGIVIAEVPTDKLGISRPQSGGWDVGAYELLDTFPPAAPVLNSLASVCVGTNGQGNIRLRWTAVSDAVRYNVYWRHASQSTWRAPIDVGDTSEYIVTGLAAGSRYYFAVTAIDTADNESARSNVLNRIANTVSCP